VTRGVRVTDLDERDLRAALDQAIAVYRRFYAAEHDFQPETSRPYRLYSTLAPADPSPSFHPFMIDY
jgi:hypothetical protein